MSIRIPRWLRATAFSSLVAVCIGCASGAELRAPGEAASGTSTARARESVPLYVISHDSLLALAEGTTVEVGLRSGARVAGTSLRPDVPGELRLLGFSGRAFEPRDTVRMPVEGIEVVVSSAPLAGNLGPYRGSRTMGPLPPPGRMPSDAVRPAIRLLTMVAIVGAVALLGVFAAQEIK